tara:strand:- start:92 stop:226 length:135 start_codon:yes stop_codon:yes gene_type:complete
MTNNKDFFSRLINWFTMTGQDKEPIIRPASQQDVFSKLMNKISS